MAKTEPRMSKGSSKGCCAVGCRNKQTKQSSVSFFRFPKDPARREVWKRNVGRAGWTPSDGTVLCSDHFTADSVDCQKFRSAFGMPAMMPRLKPDAVPTLFGICRALSTTPRDEERREVGTDTRRLITVAKASPGYCHSG
ncbi:unnamed protein product [Ixodes pacificus]